MPPTITWDKEYDVVVVGYGGSGIATAITAYDNGASVIILEKAPFPGGGQTLAAGLSLAFATDPDRAADYLYAVSSVGLENADTESQLSVVSKEDCLIFMREFANNPAWLTAMGVKHAVLSTSPADFKNLPGADAFRHATIKGFGAQFLATMKTQIEKRGIEVLFETPATELIQNVENQEIIGIYANSNGKQIAIKARKGVVLCTGGFEFNEEMKANYLRPYPLKFCGWLYKYL